MGVVVIITDKKRFQIPEGARDANNATIRSKCETFVISARRKAKYTTVTSTFGLGFRV